jgi:hypothetical protein
MNTIVMILLLATLSLSPSDAKAGDIDICVTFGDIVYAVALARDEGIPFEDSVAYSIRYLNPDVRRAVEDSFETERGKRGLAVLARQAYGNRVTPFNLRKYTIQSCMS